MHSIEGPFTIRDAMKLVQRIQADGVNGAATIIDIGCGSGNTTSVLSILIPHDRIFGLDIDPNMVEFARARNLADNSAEFFVQDIGVPWTDLHPKLQSLEGSVDLVWSNSALHWVPEGNRRQAAQNIGRLLRSGGHLYANITLIVDPTQYLGREATLEDRKLLSVSTPKEQRRQWEEFCFQSGLTKWSTTINFVTKEWTYANTEQFEAVFDAITSYFRRYLPDHLTIEEKDEILERKYRAAIIKARTVPISPELDVKNEENEGLAAYELIERSRSTFKGQFQLKGIRS